MFKRKKKKNNKEIFNTSVVFWVFKMPHRSSSHGHHSHGHSGSKKHALKVERVRRISLFSVNIKCHHFVASGKHTLKVSFKFKTRQEQLYNEQESNWSYLCFQKAVRTTISRDFLQTKISFIYVFVFCEIDNNNQIIYDIL